MWNSRSVKGNALAEEIMAMVITCSRNTQKAVRKWSSGTSKLCKVRAMSKQAMLACLWVSAPAGNTHLQLLGSLTLVPSHWAGVHITETTKILSKGGIWRLNLSSHSKLYLSVIWGSFFRKAPPVAANLVAPLLPRWGCWLRTNFFTWKLFLTNIMEIFYLQHVLKP